MARDLVWTPEIVPNGGIDESRSISQIDDNKWAAASNVEPLRDGCRMRRGRLQTNAAAIQAIATSSEDGTDTEPFTDTTDEYIAQGFQLSADATVDTISVRLKKTGAPTGVIDCAIYTDNTGPDAAVTGLDFAQFGNLDSTTLTTEYAWYRFSVATGVALTQTTQYYIVISHVNAAAATNFVDIEEAATGNPYASGQKYYSTDGSAWNADASADVNFRVYGGDAVITGIMNYETADGTVQRHLVFADGELYKKEGATGSATMTSVSAREREEMVNGSDTFPSMAVGQDRCMVAPGGTELARKFYVSGGTEYWENESIAAPTAVPSLAAGGSGHSLPAGTYEVDYCYWNDDINIQSAFKYQGLSAPTQVISSGQQLQITNLPADIVRENDRATHIRIYLKLTTESIFTLEDEIALGTTSVNITARDNGVEAVYDHLLAPIHTIKRVAENRQFIAGIQNFPYRLQWSLIDGIDSYYESYPTLQYRDLGKGDADRITALAFIPPRTLIVGMKNSIRAIDARRPGTSDVVEISDDIGIAHHLAFVVVGRRLYFVSDARKGKGLYTWAGSGEPQLVGGVDDTFKALNQGRLRYASCAHLAPGDERFQWWTLLSSGSIPDTVLVYDYTLGAWAQYPYTGNVIGNFEESSVDKIFLGGRDGYERECDTGTTDDGTAINTSLELKAFDFGTQEMLKKMRFFDYVAEQKASGSLALQVLSDFGARGPFSENLEYAGASGAFVLGTSSWGGGDVLGGGTGNVTKRVAIRGIGKFLQPTMSSADDWFLKSVAMSVQPLGRRFS